MTKTYGFRCRRQCLGSVASTRNVTDQLTFNFQKWVSSGQYSPDDV